ncbi:hypothetical protein [Pseudovibrio japonicus]|nr:hypothetical protein [Pseudovibrio japonicus]
MNSKMVDIYNRLPVEVGRIDPALQKLAFSGFKEKDGCTFLTASLTTETNASIDMFPDRTGYECFINSINIDDFVKNNFLEQGISFVQEVFSQWNKFKPPRKRIALLIATEWGVKVKIHSHRQDEWWLADDLEGYEEPILVISSL